MWILLPAPVYWAGSLDDVPLEAAVSVVVGRLVVSAMVVVLGATGELVNVGSTDAEVADTSSLVVSGALEVAPPSVSGRSRVTPYVAHRETANSTVAVLKDQH